jgi:lycopene beta-cyclase
VRLKDYDYIIAGAGCAGLSLAVRLIDAGLADGKRILLADREPKTVNDRTWCFWEQEAGLFESIVFRSWKQLWFHSQNRSALLDLNPYEYKMIRGADFYNYCFDKIRAAGITFIQGSVGELTANAEKASISIDGRAYSADYVFSSINNDVIPRQEGKLYLLQHFIGWRIRTKAACFTPAAATLMDFRVTQQHGHCFIYILPFSEQEALVECTFFSERTLPVDVYEDILKRYIQDRLSQPYEIVETEQGVIPMTNHRFPQSAGRLVFLGTAGGHTKPSSGYTFKFIQEHTAAIVRSLAATGSPHQAPKPKTRFSMYDTVMLHVLCHSTIPADTIFESFFLRNHSKEVLAFLQNDSTLKDELAIISRLPKMPFITAAWKELRKKFSPKT